MRENIHSQWHLPRRRRRTRCLCIRRLNRYQARTEVTPDERASMASVQYRSSCLQARHLYPQSDTVEPVNKKVSGSMLSLNKLRNAVATVQVGFGDG